MNNLNENEFKNLKKYFFRVQGVISFECGNWTLYAQARNNYGWSSDTTDELSNILISGK